jgi:hypothetical protein
MASPEGYYTPGSSPGAQEIWHATRILNGDETDRGIRFPHPSASSTNRDANTSVSGDFGCGRNRPFRAQGGAYHAGPILNNAVSLGIASQLAHKRTCSVKHS